MNRKRTRDQGPYDYGGRLGRGPLSIYEGWIIDHCPTDEGCAPQVSAPQTAHCTLQPSAPPVRTTCAPPVRTCGSHVQTCGPHVQTCGPHVCYAGGPPVRKPGPFAAMPPGGPALPSLTAGAPARRGTPARMCKHTGMRASLCMHAVCVCVCVHVHVCAYTCVCVCVCVCV